MGQSGWYSINMGDDDDLDEDDDTIGEVPQDLIRHEDRLRELGIDA